MLHDTVKYFGFCVGFRPRWLLLFVCEATKKRNSGWGNCGASLVDFRRFLGFSGGYFDSANRFDQLLRAECILLLPIKFLRRRLIVILYEKDCAMRALRPHSEEKNQLWIFGILPMHQGETARDLDIQGPSTML